jgi:chromosome segregation ATPase
MADTAQEVFSKMQTIDTQLHKHEAEAKKAFEGAKKSLRSAIDDESEDEITLALPALDAAVTKLDQNVDACDRLHVLTTELMKHPEFIASHKADVKTIVTHFGHQKKELSDWLKEARSLQAEAKKAAALSQKGDRETEADLGGLKNRASKLAKDILDCKTQFPKLDKAARDATDKDDDKTAEKARLQIWDLMVEPKRYVAELRPLFLKFKSEHPDLQGDQKSDLQDVADTLEDADDTLADGQKRFVTLIKVKQQAAADNAQRPQAPLEVPKPELIKLAPIVGFDPKDAKAISELGKLFAKTPHDKWAEALPKLQAQLKLKVTQGKAMVLAIEKQPFFKRQAQATH